ncbi:MAG TPA: hypothetical protein PK668_27565 [Myxococcota bacterium]|nr:hypothetical protein [Myxococcota bacterium]HRY97287.1 hypothetical protein [Myxococcota bacterium]
MLLEYRDNAGVPAYCKSPEPLLAEMARAISADSTEGGCVAQKIQDLSGASMVDIQCQVGEASGDCRDVYRAMVWGERDPRSTTWFNLVSLGWVVRRCASEEEPYRATDAAVARSAGVSNVVNRFLRTCQPDVVYIGQASAHLVVQGVGAAFEGEMTQ